MGDVSEPQAALGTPKANRGHENLIPAKPGEVRNPTGKNQYTDSPARQFEAALQAAARDRAQEIIDRLVTEAANGNERMMQMVLDRMARKIEAIDDAGQTINHLRLSWATDAPDEHGGE